MAREKRSMSDRPVEEKPCSPLPPLDRNSVSLRFSYLECFSFKVIRVVYSGDLVILAGIDIVTPPRAHARTILYISRRAEQKSAYMEVRKLTIG